MLSRPTTDELIADCCRELTEHILPALDDETLQVRLVMTETVLRNAAVRAAHEIAWMVQEAEALRAYVRAVGEAHPAAPEAPDGTGGLHLADVVHDYERAGRAFEAALAVAREADDAELIAAARELLRTRVEHEKRVMATYAVVGR